MKSDYNPNSFRIVKVKDWFKTNPANAIRPLGTHKFSIAIYIYIDNLAVKKSKIKADFLLINE